MGALFDDDADPSKRVSVADLPEAMRSLIPGSQAAADAPREDGLLDDVAEWFRRYVGTVHDDDVRLLALWAVHTHVARECYTTPRLLIDSPVPESGKTTCLSHLQRLSFKPVLMSTVSSSALLVRLVEHDARTILIDEADRSLRPENPMTPDLIAVLNSGYKKGASRPVLVPNKGGDWETREMPTFAPVALAGNSPNLPEDTQTRTIRVLLMPSIEITESDWELIEADASRLSARISGWADQHRDQIQQSQPDLPAEITGRFREKWKPLARVAEVAQGDWPQAVIRMALADVEQVKADKEDGMITERPHVLLIRHLAEIWPADSDHATASWLCLELAEGWPHIWGASSPKGRPITPQGLGRMLAKHYKINSSRLDATTRAYLRASFTRAWQAFGIEPK